MAYRVQFDLTGSTALLMHQFNIEGQELLKEWREDPANKNQSKKGDDRTPPWTWQTYLYNDGNHVTMPHDNLMGALLKGGAQVTLKGKKTYKELSQSAIFIEQEFMDFRVGNTKIKMADITAMADKSFREQAVAVTKLGFRLFSKGVSVNNARHIRVRPRFDTWAIQGTAMISSDDMKFEALQQIFGFAGACGLGDWRPGTKGRPGSYGQFKSRLVVLK